jgi:hypothetical protein
MKQIYKLSLLLILLTYIASETTFTFSAAYSWILIAIDDIIYFQSNIHKEKIILKSIRGRMVGFLPEVPHYFLIINNDNEYQYGFKKSNIDTRDLLIRLLGYNIGEFPSYKEVDAISLSEEKLNQNFDNIQINDGDRLIVEGDKVFRKEDGELLLTRKKSLKRHFKK